MQIETHFSMAYNIQGLCGKYNTQKLIYAILVTSFSFIKYYMNGELPDLPAYGADQANVVKLAKMFADHI